MVPSGTAALAAAVTLSAVSPVRRVSVMPLAMWPPLLGSKLAGGVALGSGVACAGAATVVSVVWALAVPLRNAAPIAPPASVVPRRVAPITALRMEFIFGASLVCRPDPFG